MVFYDARTEKVTAYDGREKPQAATIAREQIRRGGF